MGHHSKSSSNGCHKCCSSNRNCKCKRGPKGCRGKHGTTGPTGATGPCCPGATGSQGPEGAPGATGTSGTPGATGATGPCCPGATGSQGPPGPPGTPGAPGAPGAAGATGATGPAGSEKSCLIPFSTGIILSGATVVSAAPVLMGFGNHTVEVIDAGGESTMPPEAAGFAFPIPFDGVIQNLQVSADLLVASVVSINVTPLTYVFTVFKASSFPNNGTHHLASAYVTTAYSTSVTFGPGVTAGNFYAASNLNNINSLSVSAGDRIGIRIRTAVGSDPSAADITQLAFNASLSYVAN